MPFVHGRLGYFKLSTNDLSAFMDNIDGGVESDEHETTTYGKSWKTRLGGLKDGTYSIGGLYDSAAGGPQTIIPPLVGTVVAFEYGPEGSTTGKVKESGNVLVMNFRKSQPVGDVIRWTAELRTTDTVTTGTFV